MTLQRMCLPVDAWPDADRARWQRGAEAQDLFDDMSCDMSWRPRTRATVTEGYGYALAWLKQNAQLMPCVAPTLRWPPSVLSAYINDMKARLSSATIHNRVLNLERALAVVDPAGDRAHLCTAVRNLARRTGTSSRKRVRLQEPANLVDLGFKLMNQADARHHCSDRKNAARFRDGLQIALLAHCPIRRSNFASLELDRQLTRASGAWRIVLTSDLTKNRQPMDVPFPAVLEACLSRYLTVYRPILAGSTYVGQRVWLTYLGSAQAPHSLQLRITQLTEQEFGKSINPHLFRDCVATSIAIHAPENVRMAATILGHRAFATMEKHYNLAHTLSAGLSLAEVIERRRRAARGRAR